jgi:hypothetical protein
MPRNAGVALGRVEVLVTEELLDLAQVGAGAQELGGEDVAHGVGGDSLSLADPGGPHVAEEGLGQDRRRQPPTLDADEERTLRDAPANREIVEQERQQGGVEGDDASPSALGPANSDQSVLEVDVLPVEAEQLRAAKAGVGEEGEQEPVALALAGVLARPDVVALDRAEEAAKLAAVEHVGERLPLLGGAEDRGRISLDLLVLGQEAEEALERRDAPRLARRRRAPRK